MFFPLIGEKLRVNQDKINNCLGEIFFFFSPVFLNWEKSFLLSFSSLTEPWFLESFDRLYVHFVEIKIKYKKTMNTRVSLLHLALFYRTVPLFCCWTYFISLNFLSYLTANIIHLSQIKVYLIFSAFLTSINQFKGYHCDRVPAWYFTQIKCQLLIILKSHATKLLLKVTD